MATKHQGSWSSSQRKSILHGVIWLECLTCLEASAPHGLRMAAPCRPFVPMSQGAGCLSVVCVELTNGLPLGCMPSIGLLRLAWQ